MRLVVVGGVPGSGKSTALRGHIGAGGVIVLDPDRIRRFVRWRPLVHALHQGTVWAVTAIGPDVLAATGTTAVLVQDTATRPRRRESYLRLARRRRWQVRLLLIDVPREAALAGQVERGRMLGAAAFQRHWQRWERLLGDLEGVGVRPIVTGREHVAEHLARVTTTADGLGLPPTGPACRPARELSLV